MAKVNAEGNATHYVAEGQPVPVDLPAEVRLVGPGAPGSGSAAPEPVPVTPDPPQAPAPIPGPDLMPPGSSGESSDPADDGPADYASYPIRILRDLVRDRGLPVAGSKAELVTRLEEHDRVAA